jgi:hypothetical protein
VSSCDAFSLRGVARHCKKWHALAANKIDARKWKKDGWKHSPMA